MLALLWLVGSASAEGFVGTLHGDYWPGSPPLDDFEDWVVFPQLVLHGRDGVDYVVQDEAGPGGSHTAMAAACMGGMTVIEGERRRLQPAGFADWAIENARVVACVPPAQRPPAALGEPLTLTGSVHFMWRYGRPGYGADPAGDHRGMALEIDVNGQSVPVTLAESLPKRPLSAIMLACEGQSITVTGTIVEFRAIGLAPTWRLELTEHPAPCAHPVARLPGAPGVPVPPEWFVATAPNP